MAARKVLPVVSYNVLSSHLCDPTYHYKCDPNNLNPTVRYPRLETKLLPHIQTRAIICLQEVSMLWSGRLCSFFDAHQYKTIFSLYGWYGNGYMGCFIAYPAEFNLITSDISVVSETKKWPKPITTNSVFPAFLGSLTSTLLQFWPFHLRPGLVAVRPSYDEPPWAVAKARANTLIFLRLQCLTSKVVFCIGTYHMPCVFKVPQVMTCHAALVSQRMQALAGIDPYILAGDFNFKPGDPAYNLVITGDISITDAAYPCMLPEDPWRPALREGMRSAYQQNRTIEPEFTNYGQTKGEEAFIGTLDYIFYSPSSAIAVTDVVALCALAATQGPLPTADEPSDHILIGATFTIT